jgi:hypothetical protein
MLEFQEQIAAWKIKYYVHLYKSKVAASQYQSDRRHWGKQGKAMQIKISELKKEFESYHKDDLVSKNEDLKTENKALKEIFADMKGEKNALSIAMDDLKKRNKDVEKKMLSEREQYETRLVFCGGQIEENRRITQLVREELEVSRRACQDCMKTIATLENKLEESIKDTQIWKDIAAAGGHDYLLRNNELDARVRDQSNTIEAMTRKMNETEEMNQTLNNNISNMQNEIDYLSSTIEELNTKISAMNNEMVKSDNEKLSVQRLLAEVTLQYHTTEKNLFAANEKYQTLENEYNSLQSELGNRLRALGDTTNILSSTQNVAYNVTVKMDNINMQHENKCMYIEDIQEKSRMQIGALMHLTAYSHMLESQLVMARQGEYLEVAHLPYVPIASYADIRNNSLLKHFNLLFDFNGNLRRQPNESASNSPQHDSKRLMSSSLMSPGASIEDGSLVDSSFRSTITHPLESRLMKLLTVLENKMFSPSTAPNEIFNNISSSTENNNNTNTINNNNGDMNIANRSASLTSLREDSGSVGFESVTLDACEALVAQINAEKDNLEQCKSQLAEYKMKIQEIQDEKAAVHNSIVKWQRNEYKRTGVMPKSKGNSTTSKALFDAFSSLDNELNKTLLDAQNLASLAVSYKQKCDALQDELDDLYHIRKLETERLKKEKSKQTAKEFKKPVLMHRNTLSILNDPAFTNVQQNHKRQQSHDVIYEDGDEDNDDLSYNSRRSRDNNIRENQYNSNDNRTSNNHRGGNNMRDNNLSESHRTKDNMSSIASNDNYRYSDRPKAHRQDLDNRYDDDRSNNNRSLLHKNSSNKIVDINNSQSIVSGDFYDAVDNGDEISKELSFSHDDTSKKTPYVQKERPKYSNFDFVDFQNEIKKHKTALMKLDQDKKIAKDNIEKWTIYFLKDQHRVPGLSDTKYGSNNYLFESFNSIQLEIYSHHSSIVEMTNYIGANCPNILSDLKHLLKDPLLSLAENEEYEDAYKIHFESVESLLSGNIEELKNDEANDKLYNPITTMDFDSLNNQAKIDVLENIDADLHVFHQDVSELHAVLRETRIHANDYNAKLSTLKQQLKEWTDKYITEHNITPTEDTLKNEAKGIYDEFHHNRVKLNEELEKMRIVAIVATSKVTESEKLRMLKKKFISKAPSSYGENRANASSSLSRVYSGEFNDAVKYADDASVETSEGNQSLSTKNENGSGMDISGLKSYLQSSEVEITKLKEMKSNLKRKINEWNDKIYAQYHRKATASDRTDDIERLYENYEKVQDKLTEVLEQREGAQVMLQKMRHNLNRQGTSMILDDDAM